ncbi:MAG: hypothetical protein ABFR75_14235 [Acidobacteriota bacterium]
MRTIKKLIFFFSFVAFYFIGKEFLNLYLSIKELNGSFAAIFLVLLGIIVIYFVVLPIYKIIKLPKFPPPARKKLYEKIVIRKRISLLKKNKFLMKIGYDLSSISSSQDEYKLVISEIQKESKKIREDYISNTFISTAIAQNGFIDGIILISANINLIKETFILFGGRATYKDLASIAKSIYYSVAISGSEIIESGVSEVVEKIGPEFLKKIPVVGLIAKSAADGFVSAALLCRVGLITENYCTLTYIESDKKLYPGRKIIMDTVTSIVKRNREKKSK